MHEWLNSKSSDDEIWNSNSTCCIGLIVFARCEIRMMPSVHPVIEICINTKYNNIHLTMYYIAVFIEAHRKVSSMFSSVLYSDSHVAEAGQSYKVFNRCFNNSSSAPGFTIAKSTCHLTYTHACQQQMQWRA